MIVGIKSYLERAEILEPIILGQMPDQPDNCIALYEYAGFPPDLHWNGEYPGLQIRVRDIGYENGKERIERIVQILHGLNEKMLAGERYLLIKAKGSPAMLKRDASGRVEFVINFDVIKETMGEAWKDYAYMIWSDLILRR